MAVLSLFPLIAYCGAKVYFCNRLTGVIHRKVLVVTPQQLGGIPKICSNTMPFVHEFVASPNFGDFPGTVECEG